MFLHKHPYPPFIPDGATKLIVGTLPPPRFSTRKLLERDVNFSYGSFYNSLWGYIDAMYKLNLRFDNSNEAIEQRKEFLRKKNIGICDIVESCEREKIDASDLGMKSIVLRDLMAYIIKHKDVDTLLFMGGASKNGPEYFFRKHLKEYNLKLSLLDSNIPKKHSFKFFDGETKRIITTVSLTSPSGSANRAIGSHDEYKKLKEEDASFSTFDYRINQYQKFI